MSALSTPSTPLASPLSQLEIGLTSLAGDIASLQKQTDSHSSRSQPKPSTPQVKSAHPARSNTADIFWYTIFGVKPRRYISSCYFHFKQSKQNYN
ncbi:hypothetical protein SprV_0401477300 [Sparganum proliferum]